MMKRSLHPNTTTMLDAWRRLSSTGDAVLPGGDVTAPADLVERLFVLQLTNDGAWAFRNASDSLSALHGRDLVDRDFLDFWLGQDRSMVGGLLESVVRERAPGLVSGRGETLTGRRLDFEISLAPLARIDSQGTPSRLLGLYQTLGGEPMLQGRPIWRHVITSLHPAERPTIGPGLKIVVSNP